MNPFDSKKKDGEAKPLDIVSAYGAVLEQREKFGVAVPLSLLPFSKAQIKAALKTAISVTHDPQSREGLRAGYIALADFIPDQLAEVVNENWKEAADAECATDKELAATQADKAMEEVVRIQKGIADEGALLLMDLEKFIAEIPE
jgi:hypothetical protein